MIALVIAPRSQSALWPHLYAPAPVLDDLAPVHLGTAGQAGRCGEDAKNAYAARLLGMKVGLEPGHNPQQSHVARLREQD